MVPFVDRVYEILREPTDTWLEIKEEPSTTRQLYLRYAIPLAAIPPAARIVGMTVTGISFLGVRYHSPFLSALGYGFASYALSLLAIYITAFLTDKLAPRFGGQQNRDQAFRLIIYSSIPYWIGSLLLVIPSLAPIVTVISLYGYYLLFKGLPILMVTPRKNLPFYFLSLVAITVVFSFAIASIATVLFLEGNLTAR